MAQVPLTLPFPGSIQQMRNQSNYADLDLKFQEYERRKIKKERDMEKRAKKSEHHGRLNSEGENFFKEYKNDPYGEEDSNPVFQHTKTIMNFVILIE